MSVITQRPFPIKTNTACQLKWSHSTVFLTKRSTSSCHRVHHDRIGEEFDFHNTVEKIEAREKMLRGEWPGKGCEHCKLIEDQGGTSDRILHLDFPGIGAPPELLSGDLTATTVTPRWVEIYFSNLCNLACLYCGEHFSSTWESENKKFGLRGPLLDEPINKSRTTSYSENSVELNSKMFAWLDKNVQHLYNLMILGGEPFTQPQSDQLLDFLAERANPNLTLTFFSNLSVDHERMKTRFNRMQKLKDDGKLAEIHVIGSIDNWGPHAEYVRHGLDLTKFEKNIEYLIYNTTAKVGINSAWTSLTTFQMPELVKKINHWSQDRNTVEKGGPVYFSVMQAAGGRFLHPEIFGPKVLEWGFSEAIDLFETHGDQVKSGYKMYLDGISKKIAASVPDIAAQKDLHTFLNTTDKRRNTDYRVVFPEIYKELKQFDL